MAKGGKKFYAVRKGRRTGIFETWEECSAQVNGIANEYKGFATRSEAEQWLQHGSAAPKAAPRAPAGPSTSSWSGAGLPAPPPALPVAPAPSLKRPRAPLPPPEPIGGEDIVVFADGGCEPNPGPGGWAYAAVLPPGASGTGAHALRARSGFDPATTNNRMELRAAIAGLGAVPPGHPGRVHMHVDSQYVMRGLTEWLPNWRRNGWRTAAGRPVENQGLWQELEAAAAPHRLAWHWVKGHSGVAGNEYVDAMAGRAIAAGAGAAADEGPGPALRLLGRAPPPLPLEPVAKRPRPGSRAP